jgi:predicted AlkP superfamily pyrophosphatase or phosphodiesterase
VIGRLAAALLVTAVALSLGATPLQRTARPVHARRVLIVSIDGLRPDVLLRGDAPRLRELMARGSFSMWAQTTPAAVTLPSHVSMLTGVTPAVHGIEWNQDLPLSKRIYPARPTLFELAKRAGYSTALAAGKSKFSALTKPGTLDWTFVAPITVIPDSFIVAVVLRWIAAHPPEVLFVHLPGVDFAGHEHGWGSPQQLAALATIDRGLGRILDALKQRHLLESTVVLVTSDHGGAGTSHGPDDPRSRYIPWILAGPGVRKDYDLTRDAALVIRTEDTFATACAVLGIKPPQPIEGRVVTQAFERVPAP